MNEMKSPNRADPVLRVVKKMAEPRRRFGEMLIILEKHCSFLENDLTKAFEGQRGIEVIVDRRAGEGLGDGKKTSSERRKPKEHLLEVVIFT